jgi:hypothetical protein
LFCLRTDIANVTKFFKENGAKVLSMRRLFEVLRSLNSNVLYFFQLIVDPLIEEKDSQKILNEERTDNLLIDDNVFMSTYIPHKLDHIEQFERDHNLEKQGIEPNNPFQKVIGKILTGKNINNGNKLDGHSEKGRKFTVSGIIKTHYKMKHHQIMDPIPIPMKREV